MVISAPGGVAGAGVVCRGSGWALLLAGRAWPAGGRLPPRAWVRPPAAILCLFPGAPWPG